jgi:hypothetical protein
MTAPFQDLRGQTLTYAPTGGINYGQANQYLGQAAKAAGGINIGSVALPNYSNTQQTQQLINQAKQGYAITPDQQRLRDMSMQQLQGLNTAPDRAQLAAQALSLQRQMTAPAWQQDLRQAGQQAAALGRIGAGMTTNELNDITLAREKALGQFGEQAALEAAGQTMADRLARAGVITGYEAQRTGEDQARAGGLAGLGGLQFGLDTNRFNEGLQRSGLDLSIEKAQADAAAARAGVYGGLGSTSASMANSAASLRAEQAARAAAMAQQQQQFQASQAQQQIDNRMQQQLLQEQLLNGQFNRQLTGAQAAGGYGFANDPFGTMMAGAAYAQPRY